ncbi:MAG: hypothetical protein ABI156_13630 [Caldimonas sp.]
MQDAGKLLSSAWVAQTDKEAQKDWKAWDKTKQKKWSQDYLNLSLKAFGIVLDNAKETLGKVGAIKDSVKTAIDGTEKIVESKRKKNTPLSDAERTWIAKSKATVADSAKLADDAIKAFSDHSPMAGRIDYYKGALAAGAIGADVPAKIMATRKASIDVGAEFGKSGPAIIRLEEYRKRWAILMAELSGLEKQRSGNVQEWALAINKQLKDFQAGNEKWAFALDGIISKIARNLQNTLGKIDETPKGFGASLAQAIKVKVSSKAKGKAADDLMALKIYLKNTADNLKAAKGSLKTRLVEFQSLTVSLKDAGPYADPQRKVLAALGLKLAEYQKSVDTLVVQVDAAAAAAR